MFIARSPRLCVLGHPLSPFQNRLIHRADVLQRHIGINRVRREEYQVGVSPAYVYRVSNLLSNLRWGAHRQFRRDRKRAKDDERVTFPCPFLDNIFDIHSAFWLESLEPLNTTVN